MHYNQFSPHGVNADMLDKYHHLNCWILLMNPTILLTKSVDLTNGTGGTEAFQLLFQAKMREILSETHQETAFYLLKKTTRHLRIQTRHIPKSTTKHQRKST